MPPGSGPALVTESGFVIGAGGTPEPAGVGETGIQTVLDPSTGEVVAIDPQGAISTGGGLRIDPGGKFRFVSGGFVGRTVAGSGLAGTEAPGGGIFGIGTTGGEIIPASFEDPAVLIKKKEEEALASLLR